MASGPLPILGWPAIWQRGNVAMCKVAMWQCGNVQGGNVALRLLAILGWPAHSIFSFMSKIGEVP